MKESERLSLVELVRWVKDVVVVVVVVAKKLYMDAGIKPLCPHLRNTFN